MLLPRLSEVILFTAIQIIINNGHRALGEGGRAVGWLFYLISS